MTDEHHWDYCQIILTNASLSPYHTQSTFVCQHDGKMQFLCKFSLKTRAFDTGAECIDPYLLFLSNG